MSRSLLVANPSADVYGSDLQLLESVSAAIDAGWQVTVTTPDDGPLVPLLTQRGAEVRFVDYPVLRRSDATLSGVAKLACRSVAAVASIRRLVRSVAPDAVYVNTVTLPWWPLATRLARRPVVVHVHEAEAGDPLPVRLALNAPLWAASALIVISRASMDATTSIPFLRGRAHLIYNGVPPHGSVTPTSDLGRRPVRLLCIGRLSPRKGTDVALEATAALRARGVDVELEICGTPFAGYEWYEAELRERAAAPDLAGAVEFSGYVNPVAPALARADIVLAPSLREPFGNVVVEAQLARRPVIAAAAMGHLETVQDEVTGLLVEPGSADEMATAVERLLDNPRLAATIAASGHDRSSTEFAPARYRAEIAALLDGLTGGSLR